WRSHGEHALQQMAAHARKRVGGGESGGGQALLPRVSAKAGIRFHALLHSLAYAGRSRGTPNPCLAPGAVRAGRFQKEIRGTTKYTKPKIRDFHSIPMTKTAFNQKLKQLRQRHEQLLRRRNRPQKNGNGIFYRYEFPVLTAEHTPLSWRYDFNPATNPRLMTRLGINSVFNVGAMEWNGKVILMARVEGWDRKSFFAVAESRSGIDAFKFWDYPVRMPEHEAQETNLYDMRLVRHEDGWIYGLFCAERHDDSK